MSQLILASGSPRRREILSRLGFEFEVRPVNIDEQRLAGESALAYVERLARAKASADVRSGELVLAADTIVELDGELLGKPRAAEEAAAMLRRLSGRRHTVSTGVAVADADRDTLAHEVVTTAVSFRRLSDDEIDWYVASGEPMDKAGAYAIQGLGSFFVEGIDGNYSNVVGLPVPAVHALLTRLGAAELLPTSTSRG